MELKNIEFNIRPDGEVEVRFKGENVFTLEPTNREFINLFIELIISKRSIAFTALEKRYAKSKENTIYFEFLIVRGFIKCNFSMLDNQADVDENGNFNTEYIPCPRMGECSEYGYICNSPINTELSPREIDILRLIKEGLDNVAIADRLYISVNTVHTHRNNILKKTGSENTADMVRYWYECELK